MLILWNTFGHSTSRESFQHDIDADKTIAAAIDEDDWRPNVSGWVLGRLVETLTRSNTKGQRHVDLVIEKLEVLVSDNLKPMDDRLSASERIQVRICRKLLKVANVLALPVEENRQCCVDYASVDRRVEKRLPHDRGAENSPSAKEEKQEVRRRFHQRIHGGIGETRRSHCRRKSHKNIDLLIQIRVDRESCKRLSGALGKPNIRQRRLTRHLQDILYAVWDIVKSKLIDRKAPKLICDRRMFDGLLRVFITPIIPQPYIVPFLDELEGQASSLVRHAHPHLTAHEQAMMEVDDFLPDASLALVYQQMLFPSPRGQTVKAQEVTIAGLNNVFLSCIAKQCTYIREVRRFGY